MIPFLPRQQERFESQHLMLETLVAISETDPWGAPAFTFSNNGLWYPWGHANNDGKFWEPLVSGVDNLIESMQHLPNPEQQGTALRRNLRLELWNYIDPDGVSLIERLESISLLNAYVCVADLPIDPNDPREKDGYDLRHLNIQSGGATDDIAHVTRFCGRIRRYSMPTQETVRIEAVFEIPDAFNRPIFLSEMDPRHYGMRVSHAFGRLEQVPGLNLRVPDTVRGLPSEYAVLLEPFVAGALPNVAMEIPAIDSWALGGGQLRIGKELLNYSAITSITDTSDSFYGRADTFRVQISARGQTTAVVSGGGGNATVDADHFGQDLVSRRVDIDAIDGRELVVAFGAELFWNYRNVYVTDANDGFIKKVGSVELLPVTVSEVNYESIGFGVAVVQFDLAQLGSLVQTLARDAEVTSQPAFIDDPGTGEQASTEATSSDNTEDSESAASNGNWSTLSLLWRWDDAQDDYRLECRFTEQDIYDASPESSAATRNGFLTGYRFIWYAEAQETNNIDGIEDRDQGINMWLKFRNFPGFSNTQHEIEFGRRDFSSLNTWERKLRRFPSDGSYINTMPPGTTVEDWAKLNLGMDFWCKRISRYEGVNQSEPEMRLGSGWGIQYKYFRGATFHELVTPVAIFARGDSIDYRFYLDADGGVNDTFDGSRNNAAQIMKYMCEFTWPHGLRSAVVSDSTWDDAATRLADVNLAILTNEFGSTLESQLAGIAYNCRTQIVASQRESTGQGDFGLRYRPLVAIGPIVPNAAGYLWDNAVLTIDQYDEIGFESRDTDSIYTGFRAMWRPQRATRVGDKGFQELHEHLKIGSVEHTDFDNAPAVLDDIINEYGDWNAPMFEFQGIGRPDDTETTIGNVFGYFIQELTRNAHVYIVSRVPWVQHASLELGDVVDLVIPWDTTRKTRVLEINRSFSDGFADMRLVRA